MVACHDTIPEELWTLRFSREPHSIIAGVLLPGTHKVRALGLYRPGNQIKPARFGKGPIPLWLRSYDDRSYVSHGSQTLQTKEVP